MDYTADKTLDIKGEHCPFTFVRTKLAIEPMATGEVLEVLTDHKPATENVPRSMDSEGHELVLMEQVGDKEWKMVFRKG